LIMPIAIRSYLSPVAALFNLFDKDNSNALVQQEAAIIAGINNNIDKVLEKANFRPRIYFSNYPINGQRVLMPAEQQQAAEQAAMALISDTLNNLQIIALARLKDGDGPLIQIANLISKMARCGSFDAINADIIKHLQELPVKGLFAEDSPQAKQLKLLHTVLCDYVTLHRDTAMGNGNNRGLFLSSLQSILINSMGGIDAGHCISGKDRTALVNIHTKAMLSHYEKYGRLPKYRDSDKQRKDFVAEFAALYKSLHDQEQAGFNNRGSAGIKDEPGIKTTMPKDMAKALNKTMVISKRAANLNKPNPKPGQWKKLIPIVLISLLAIAACVACPYLIPIMGISLALVTLGVTLGMLAGVLTFKQTEGKQLSVRIALSLAVAALVASVFAAPFIGSLLAPTAPLLAAATTALSTALTGLYTIAIIPVIAAVGIVTAKLKDWWWQRGLTKHSVEVMQQSNKDEPILVSAVDKRSSSDSQVIAKLALIPSKVSEVDNPSPPSSNENLASGIALKKLPVNDAAMPEKDGSRSHDGRVQSLAEQLARFDQDVLHHPSVTPSSMVADEEGTASSSSLSKPGKLK